MANPLLDAVTAVGRRLKQAYDATDAPGAEFHPSPFRPGEVTGEAVALKSLAALIAGRRAAANARVKQEAADAAIAHRNALTQQIQAKLAAPAAPTYRVKLPSGSEVDMTGPQLAVHERWLRTQEGTQGRWQKGQEGIWSRFNTSLDERRKGRGAGQRRLAAQSALENLDKEAKADGDIAAQRAKDMVDGNIRIIMDQRSTPEQKAAAASALRLIPMKNTGVSKGRQVTYDLGSAETKAALADIVERYRRRAITTTLNAQQARRNALRAVSLEESGIMLEEDSALDPESVGIEWAPEELEYLRALGVDPGAPGSRDLQRIPDDQPIED